MLSERSEGSLIVKIYLDRQRRFKNEIKLGLDDDPNVQWELNPPM